MTEEGPTPRPGTPVWPPSATREQQPTTTEQQPATTEQQPTTTEQPTTAEQLATPPSPEPLPYQPPVAPPFQAAAPLQPYQGVHQGAYQQPHGQSAVPYGAPQPYPYQGQPQQYPYQQGPWSYGPPQQPLPTPAGMAPYGRAPDWVQAVPPYRAAPVKPSALPIEPKRYSQFLQTPRRRWWKLPIALVAAGVAWLVGTIIVSIPAVAWDIITQRIDLTDPVALQEYAGGLTTHVTPAIFLANNVGIALMIPCAWLGMIVYGQRPRWLSSVVGGLRWGWLFRILGFLLIPYIASEVFTIAVGGGLPQLSWKPYSLFMILVILFTTPLQCAGEEYGLRGLVNRLAGSYRSSRASFWIGAIVSSVAFMLLHSAQDIYLNVFYFSFGMVSCWMAWRTGGLEAGIAMHVVNNMFAMAVLPFSDFSGMFDRSAGSASPLDSLPLAVVMVLCVGIVEWQVRVRKPVAVGAPGAVSPVGVPFLPAAVPQVQASR